MAGPENKRYHQSVKEKTVTASAFKARCLRLLDEVAEQSETLIVIKNGRPIAGIIPVGQKSGPLEGSWKGIVEITGDIVNFDTNSEWEAMKG